MKILIIGSGGREHALAWRCSKDSFVEKIYIAPGNAGTLDIGENVSINVKNFDEIFNFCTEENIDFVIIGPEEYLEKGLSDFLQEKGIVCFGPKKMAARLESDKSFAKEFMVKHKIPTANYKLFFKSEIKSAINFLQEVTYPVVIKVSGLAAGKGVMIVTNQKEAAKTIDEIFYQNKFGDSGNKIVIEEFLNGEEASILVVTDGENYKILPASQDHKRIFDNDQGANTGGMGAYAPTPLISKSMLKNIDDKIIKPTLNGLMKDKIQYSGCLYFGLMISNSEPYVIEYNSRFGDPETQAILPLIDGDFTGFLFSAAKGKLDLGMVSFSHSCSICVICASAGYPGDYEKNFLITGINKISNQGNKLVFHSGTVKMNGDIFTNGGRVLGVVSVDKDGNLSNCKRTVYESITQIKFDGMQYRTDISDKARKYL